MDRGLKIYSLLSRAVCARKAARYASGKATPLRAPLPVIAVGNITLGGSGKTPLALELLEFFLRRGRRPALITRGYRGSWERRGGVLSDGTRLLGGWVEAGDEPVMIARRVPEAGVFVGRHRWRSCRTAAGLGFDVAVLDDAFQHLRLARDLDIVLHDPSSSAPRREGDRALARAGILLFDRTAGPEAASACAERFPGIPAFDFAVVPKAIVPAAGGPPRPPETLRGLRLAAFCGIARPGRFFGLLESLGARIVGRLEFPDHYSYPPSGCAALAALVRRTRPEAVLTTEKDAVKLEGGRSSIGGLPVEFLRIGLDLPAAFFDRVEAAIARIRPDHA